MDKTQLQTKLISFFSGDRSSFEEIYNELKTPLYTIIFRITQNHSVAEELLHDVFIKLYGFSPDTPVKNPRAYIFKIARNLAIDEIRKSRQISDIDDPGQLIYLPAENVVQKLDIERALKTLPLTESQILTLHINGGFKFREIADITDLPLGTVLWKYRSSLNKLRIILDGGAI